MAGNFTGNHLSRSEEVDHKFWLGLSDWAVDMLGRTAATGLMQDAYAADNPQMVLEAINVRAEQELTALGSLAV